MKIADISCDTARGQQFWYRQEKKQNKTDRVSVSADDIQGTFLW